MRDKRASEIRTLLRSGELRDIGGRRETNSARASQSSTAGLVAAFAAVYLIWGSTYLAIRYAVETIPPLLMNPGLTGVSAPLSANNWMPFGPA